jgi:hypothetical protein
MAAAPTLCSPANRRRTESLPLALFTVGLAVLGPFVLVVPAEIPMDRQRRSAFGRVEIDARDLPEGHDLLPTFAYDFVRITAQDGTPVESYTYNGRPAIRHAGAVTSYTVTYDLTPELLALLAGVGVVVAYMVGERFLPEAAHTYLRPPDHLHRLLRARHAVDRRAERLA